MTNDKPDENKAKCFWVDSDFGFDDIWALLLLKHRNVKVDGVSLVSGNTPLKQVIRNAEASLRAFEFDWPWFAGAASPMQRNPETAERILGTSGMCSRGLSLPYFDSTTEQQLQPISALDAMVNWLHEEKSHHILALGPLTNLGQLVVQHPQAAAKIQQISWLGGSRGRGNHSTFAEYNALADPEALSIVANSGVPFKMIDLELCRQVCFTEADMPTMQGPNRQLVSDLLGGYLDIALQRGRSAMSIYDPLAALSIVRPGLLNFSSASLTVTLEPNAEYGRTVVELTANASNSTFETAVSVDGEQARDYCLSTLVQA